MALQSTNDVTEPPSEDEIENLHRTTFVLSGDDKDADSGEVFSAADASFD